MRLASCLPLASLALAACLTGEPADTDEDTELHEEGPHWGYDDESPDSYGPSTWADEWEECGGEAQSPVDLITVELEVGTPSPVAFSYASSALSAINNGHTLQYNATVTRNAAGYVNSSQAGALTVGEDVYHVAQFHFHTRSEHWWDGADADLELHLVHQSEDGDYAVIGLFLNGDTEITRPSPFLSAEASEVDGDGVLRFHEALALEVNHEGEATPMVDVFDFDLWFGDLEQIDLMRYAGSLTTPGCDERVTWMVAATVGELHMDDLDAFRGVFPRNNRPIQRTLTPEWLTPSVDAR